MSQPYIVSISPPFLTSFSLRHHTALRRALCAIQGVLIAAEHAQLLNLSYSLQPHGLYPARILSPWDFPGKNAGVGLPFPPSGDLPYPGIEPACFMPPSLAGGFLQLVPPGAV